MMIAAVASSLRVLRMRPCGRSAVCVGCCTANQRHHGHAGFESAQAQRQSREQNRRASASCLQSPCASSAFSQSRQSHADAQPTSIKARAEHHHIQQQIGNAYRRRQLDRFRESFQEHGREQRQQNQRDSQIRVAQQRMQIRILRRVPWPRRTPTASW